MIVKGKLTEKSKAGSRHNLKKFHFVNGLSYMCLGDTVIILFAVRLNCPDYFVAILGAMVYLGFILLPLGKIVTAHVGGARCQSTFWILRNISAMLVASATFFSVSGMHEMALGMILLGAFLFYGFRAAGVVMFHPLVGEVTDDHNRSHFLGASSGINSAGCLISLGLISLILNFTESIWVLSAIIAVGACMGVFASGYLRKVHETENLRESARRPILNELKQAIRYPRFRRQLLAGFMINVTIIMTVPASILLLKRGYGISDTGALLFSMAQLGATILFSYMSGKLSAKIGPRRLIVFAYFAMPLICLIWIFSPVKFYWPLALIPFVLAGGGIVCMNNSLTHYFLQSIPTENRVAASIFIAVTGGAGAGVIGMVLGALLMRYTTDINPGAYPLEKYRLYFTAVLVLLLIGIWVISRLKPLTEESRQRFPLFDYLFTRIR
ncbi:MAG: MFS transporter [Victivallaceae bacterium]|nr:MFS transporter [Victivallaceae bacterium]